MTGLAGKMRERVVIERRTVVEDDHGGLGDLWDVVDAVWAEVRPETGGPDVTADRRRTGGRWRVTMRPYDVRIGDRLRWQGRLLAPRAIERDPAWPDRLTIRVEEAE